MDLVQEFEQEQIQAMQRPKLAAGDIVRVTMKVKEGDKERLQAFEGTVLGIRGSGPSVTFTVRREVGRFAIERIFPLYSPLITAIDITRRQKVRRSKLSYLREAGHRRVKEDLHAMQRHRAEEAEKQRVTEAKAKKETDEKSAQEDAQAQAEKETEKKANEVKTEEKSEAKAEEQPKADKKEE